MNFVKCLKGQRYRENQGINVTELKPLAGGTIFNKLGLTVNV